MIKKVLGITASTLIVAGAATPALAANDVFNGLMFRAQGHYMEPSNERAVVVTRPAIAATQGETFFVEPGGDWDYRLGLEYMLPGSSNTALVLDYDHYSNADSKDVNNQNGAVVLASAFGGGIAPLQSNARVKYEDHAFKLGARRGLEFGNNFDVNVGAYAEYAKVERTATHTDVNGNTNRVAVLATEVSGWGPSFDMEGVWYPMGRHSCFTVSAGAEFAALWADDKYSGSIVDQAGTLVANSINNANRADISTVQTRLGATAAVGYSRPINESLAFGIKAGARWINYHNAFKDSSDLSDGRTDYGRFGPFIELRIGGVDSTV